MPRPKPAPSAVQFQPKPRPDHPFQPAPSIEATKPPVASAESGTLSSRSAATPQGRNVADGDARGEDRLVKLSVRLHPAVNRAIKLYGVENGLSFQQIALTALQQFFEREGWALPEIPVHEVGE